MERDSKFVGAASGIWRDERGVTGLPTAIVVILSLVAFSGFAYGFVGHIVAAGEVAKESTTQGVSAALATLRLRGPVIAEDTDEDGSVDRILFQVANGADGNAVDLTPGKTFLRYLNGNQVVLMDEASQFTITPRGNADTDTLVEDGELFEVASPNLGSVLASHLGASTAFTIQVIPAQGAPLSTQRTTPPVLAKYNILN